MKLIGLVFRTLLLLLGSLPALADSTTPSGEKKFSEIELRQMLELNPGGFLPEIDEGRLLSGKKTFFIDPAFDPIVGNNNLRQLLKRKTGIVLAEEEIQGVHLNVGSRGFSPINGVFSQIYQDGFPLHVDTFGSRMVGSFPDVNQVSQVQFVQSGAGILFGAQPGGALLLQSYPPVGDRPFRFKNTSTVGSYGYVADLMEAGGTMDDFSYSVFGRYARGDGLREQPDFDDSRAGFRVAQRFSDHTTVELGYQFYEFDSDRLGDIVLNTAGVNNGLNYYFQDSTRHLLQAKAIHQFDDESVVHSRFWYHYTEGFRDYTETPVPILGRTTERFHYLGTDHRWMKSYDMASMTDHLLTLGVTAQGSISPLESKPTRPGEVRVDLDRHDLNLALFLENKFQLTDRWSLTPGLRGEYIELGGDGIRGDGGVNNFAEVDREFDDMQLLASLGTEIDLLAPISIKERPLVWYANAGNGYRPPTYNETMNQGFTVRVPGGLRSAEVFTVESGLRGNPRSWFTYDASAFWINYQDQFANIGGAVRNTGRTRHRGVELFQEVDFFALADAFSDEGAAPIREQGWSQHGRLSWFVALAYLQAEVRSSPFVAAEGDEVPYAPEWIAKTGLSYNRHERFKVSIFLQSVQDHLGNATNDQGLLRDNTAAKIEGYTTLDFALEHTVWKDRLTFFFSANNLTDEKYFAVLQGGAGIGNQVRAPGRNYYGGFRFAF